mgnify:CR=1 FL=1
MQYKRNAESLAAVHTHTHTHTQYILQNKKNKTITYKAEKEASLIGFVCVEKNNIDREEIGYIMKTGKLELSF